MNKGGVRFEPRPFRCEAFLLCCRMWQSGLPIDAPGPRKPKTVLGIGIEIDCQLVATFNI